MADNDKKYIKIFATGGTFDKEYNEINGELFFKETHLFDLLKLSNEKDYGWIKGYVKWEIGVLSELGFSLKLNKCAVNGNKENLS